jgi:hypothetical protein
MSDLPYWPDKPDVYAVVHLEAEDNTDEGLEYLFFWEGPEDAPFAVTDELTVWEPDITKYMPWDVRPVARGPRCTWYVRSEAGA